MNLTMIDGGAQTHMNEARRMSTGVDIGKLKDVPRCGREDEPHKSNVQAGRTCLLDAYNNPNLDPGPVTPDTAANDSDANLQTHSSHSKWRLFRPKVKIRPYPVPVPNHIRDRFKDLKQLFDKPLYDHLCKSGARQLPVVITLQYLGEDKENAMPWIVVLCDKSVARSVRQWFRMPSIQSYCHSDDPSIPKFRVLVQESPLRLLGGPDSVRKTYVYSNVTVRDLAQDDTLCGTLIEFYTNDDSCHVGTLGGLIKVCWRDRFAIYGITVDHILHPSRLDSQRFDPSAPVRNDSSQEGRHEAPVAGMSGRSDEFDQSDESDTFDDSNSSDGDYELDLSSYELRTWHDRGLIHPTEETARLLTCEIGVVVLDAETRRWKGLDWNLIDLKDQYFYRPNALINMEAHMSLRMPTALGCDAGLSRRVWVISGVNGAQSAMMSDAPAYFHLGGGAVEFTEVYSLRLLSGSGLKSGDSGSWVVDFDSGEVYGQIVALDLFNNAYAIPFGDIVEDMSQSLMSESITFPTINDLYWCRTNLKGKTAYKFPGTFSLPDNDENFSPPGTLDSSTESASNRKASTTESSSLNDLTLKDSRANEQGGPQNGLLKPVPPTPSLHDSAPASEYVTQEIPERYIASDTLDRFIRSKPAEFGTEYQRRTRFGIYRITVKRKLTSSEIMSLQTASAGANSFFYCL